jgi:hypothetical protein
MWLVVGFTAMTSGLPGDPVRIVAVALVAPSITVTLLDPLLET